ncbi:MAG: serine/threonine-protein kinase, partial [Pseudomonadota bacterium]
MRSGQRIGRYVLGEPIARGGMAEVWAARVEGPDGFVKSLALKFILESFAGDGELERLFVNEARVAARLAHANLVGVFDFDRVADPQRGGLMRHYIAMEKVDGYDLRRVLQAARQKKQVVPPAIALHVAGEVLKGLRYVHELRDPAAPGGALGLVHRDVSPHNVLVGMGGEVKLSDFGIAKVRAQSLGTHTGMVRGKLAYSSPEQLRGETADHRADQFALGITLWEMLADRRLFAGAGADEQEIIGKVLRCEVPTLPREAGVGPAVETIVRRMLAPAVHDRFRSTADALAAVLGAPGYTADATPLVDLMKRLFGQRPLSMPPTQPLKLADPVALVADAQAVTSALEPSPVAGAAPAESDAAAAVSASSPETVRERRPVAVSEEPSVVARWWVSSDSREPLVTGTAAAPSDAGALGEGGARSRASARQDAWPAKADVVTARAVSEDAATGSNYLAVGVSAGPAWADSRPASRVRKPIAWAL